MIKLTIYLILGIVAGHYFQIDAQSILILTLAFLIILYVLMQLFKDRFDRDHLFALIIFISTLSTGILTETFHDQRQFPNHYSKKIRVTEETIVDLKLKVREILKPGRFHTKYIVEIVQIDRHKANGKLLLNIEKDTLNNPLLVDQIVYTNAQLELINSPLNPHQFNYRKYMSRKYIYHQLSLPRNAIYEFPASGHSIFGLASIIRKKIRKNLRRFNFQPAELSIINALLLGQRQDISEAVYEDYVQAGAIHILAVSGLHIGIILLILQSIFKFLDYIRNGKLIRIALVLIFLWSYAILAGLSASVVRAVTMFTVFAIAMNLKRPTNVYNTIAISIFMLLLFKPNFLFDVGFQLSYMAVLAIVSFEPPLRRLWTPRFKVVRFFWRILSVTLAAQLGVLPLSLYYFHQFPGLFFVSNLVIIPFLGIILGFGILIIILALLNLLPQFLAMAYATIIQLMNAFVAWISDQEAAVFQNISFTETDLIFSYALIIIIFIIFQKASFRYLLTALIVIISFQLFLIIDKKKNSDRAFIVFHKSRKSIIGSKNSKELSIYSNLDMTQLNNEKFLTNFLVGEDLRLIKSDS
ncbi:MAG: ComEC family competence protein, partial [Bacteroidia bacterium]|nr:ComEC family competence protein [Bacteroidia bacterium]